jgi:ATP-dependent helicase/nuclease subunit B
MRELEGQLIDAVSWHHAADPRAPLVLLAPSRSLGLHLRRRVARALGGVANLHVLTLPELARRVAGEALDQAGRRPLPPAGERLLVEGAIRAAVPESGGYFSAVAAMRNFPAALRRTLLDLKRAGVGPDELEAAVPGPKVTELAACYRAAEAALAEHGFHDTPDLLAEAARLILAEPGRLEGAAVLVYGFLELNPLETRLVAACEARGPVQWFRPDAAAPGRPAPGSVEILAAPGEEREVREIARTILQHVEAGGRFDDAGIFLRQPGAYRAVIRDLFTSAGIPYYLAPGGGAGPTLGETRAGRTLALLAEVDRSGFSRPAVIELLAFADLRPGPGVSPAEWDRLSRHAGIVGGLRDWRARLDRLGARLQGPAPPPGSDEGDPPVEGDEESRADERRDLQALAGLRRVFGRLAGGLGRLPPDGTPAELVGRLSRSLRGLLRPSADLDRLAGALAGLADLGALRPRLAREDLWTLVESTLAAPVPDAAEDREGRVYVGDLAGSVGLDFPLTVVPGLAEGSFPAAARQDPILLDRERRGLSGLPRSTDGRDLDRLRFRLVTGAGSRLLLTYPRSDTGGRPRVPSFFLLELAEAMTGDRHDFGSLAGLPWHRRIGLALASDAARAAPVDEREWLVTRALGARSAPAGLLRELPGAARGHAAIRARERDHRLTGHDGLLPSGVDPTVEPLAATWLEAYVGCPFSFFLGRALGIQPVEEPERTLTLGPADRGQLIHAVLELTYQRLLEAGLLPLRPAQEEEAQAVLDAAFDERCAEAERRGQTGLPALWEGERARLRTDLHAFLTAAAQDEKEAGWTPALLEAAFGLDVVEGSAPPVEYRLPDGTVLRLRGKIDRIDVSLDGSRARVLDYKTGRLRGSAKADRLGKGRSLQLPIYRLAAEAILAGRGGPGSAAVIEEAEYRYLFGRDAGKGVAFTRDGWERRREDFDRALSLVVEGIRAGRFFSLPAACSPRRPCTFDLACGAERRRWADAKADDPAVRRHAELEAIE